MFKRTIENILHEALKISPCVLLSGARQTGKSTLTLEQDYSYRVFDNISDRNSALNDPIGYISSLPKPIAIDEIQKVPQVLEAIKIDIDKNRVNGNFLLTGSANILDMKKTKDTLAGRIIEINLMPLSCKEIQNKPYENIIDMFFSSDISKLSLSDISIEKIYESIINGGYPEIQKIDTKLGKELWFSSYISTYIERDIRDIGELKDISSFIRFYNIIASRSTAILKKSQIANDSAISEITVNNYISMLEMIYQITLLNPYSSNISKRFIKSPKLYMNDSGILCHLLNIKSTEELINSKSKGDVVETFVFAELLKHVKYSSTKPQMYHYRTNDKKEIDFILQRANKIIAIEVKTSHTVKKDDFKHIIDLQNKTKNEVVIGIVIYSGDTIIPFGDDSCLRFAVPMRVFF
jgi:predicted AAA+ superfamily ATPase